MERSPSRPRLRLLRRLASGLWAAGVPLFGIGCGCTSCETVAGPDPIPAALSRVPAVTQPEIRTAGHAEAPQVPAKPHSVPITLDTVLRLAEEHNPRIGLAREKLHESLLVSEQNCRAWLPNTYAGVAYYRHEGGIQNEDGTLIHSSTQALYPGVQLQSELDVREATFRQINAERQVWQQKAELSQVNSETLLDAATTYIDLLIARRGEAIAEELAQNERKTLEFAQKQEKEAGSPRGIVEGVKAAMSNHQQLMARLHQQGDAASAKLVYLLGLPPETCLVPMDLLPVPIELVDVTPPVHDLVTQAMTNGPAVRELEGLLATIQASIDRSHGPQNLLPTLQVNVLEGAFGAGQDSQMRFDNRLDIGLQVRWNLTQFAQADGLRRQARSRQQQAMYNYDEVRGKLAAGVTEARGAVLAGREGIGLATDEIKNASVSYRELHKRLEENLPGASVGDTLQSIRALEQAHFNYLNNISRHNKAQIQLLLLLGAAPPAAPGHP